MRFPTNDRELAHLNVRIPERVLERLEATAFESGDRLEDAVRRMLEIGLDTYNGQEARRAA